MIRALEKTGQRGLLATGWGGLETERPPKNVFQIEEVPQRMLTADNLAASIEQTMTDAGVQRRAAELGEKIRAEDGVRNAAAFIEVHRTRPGDRAAK